MTIAILVLSCLLIGWGVRKRSERIYRIRKANQRKRAQRAAEAKSWETRQYSCWYSIEAAGASLE